MTPELQPLSQVVDVQRMEGAPGSARAVLTRRARRLGLGTVGLGVILSLIFESWYGVFVGALVVVQGLYMAYAHIPFAGWIRRLEQRRSSAR
jgi:hypothetical protein